MSFVGLGQHLSESHTIRITLIKWCHPTSNALSLCIFAYKFLKINMLIEIVVQLILKQYTLEKTNIGNLLLSFSRDKTPKKSSVYFLLVKEHQFLQLPINVLIYHSCKIENPIPYFT